MAWWIKDTRSSHYGHETWTSWIRERESEWQKATHET